VVEESQPPVDCGDHSQEDIEDLTGRIPLLLDLCTVGGKANLDPLEIVGCKAAEFTKAMRMKTKDNSDDWKLYVHLIQFL
jgi:hypothetical protein